MVYPKILAKFYEGLEKVFKDRGLIAGKSGRHMKFPYTLSAKIAQFPIFYYFKNNNIWMYWPMGWAVSFYVFNIIHKTVNSDANVAVWAEIHRKEAEEHAHH